MKFEYFHAKELFTIHVMQVSDHTQPSEEAKYGELSEVRAGKCCNNATTQTTQASINI